MLGPADLPRYSTLMYPTLVAVHVLGGSATTEQIIERVIRAVGITAEQLAVQFRTNNKSFIIDRLHWARSYCKLIGLLESPSAKLYVLTPMGAKLLALPESEARSRLSELDRKFRSSRRTPGRSPRG